VHGDARASVAHLPYLCDVRNSAAFASSELVRNERFMATWESFDPVNFAPRLRAPTLLSTGGKDTTCPSPGIEAVYERLAGIKAMAHYPELAHTSCGDFYDMTWRWLERYLFRA
jgi:cephalosporin-C deacetylase